VQENPPVNSPGRGSCVLTLDTAETQITLSCTYSGLGIKRVCRAHPRQRSGRR
jgi:hypothetical protein